MEQFIKELNNIKEDKTSGSFQLVLKGLYAFLQFLKRGKDNNDRLDRWNKGVKLFLELRPSMSIFSQSIIELYGRVSPFLLNNEWEKVFLVIEQYYEELNNSIKYIVDGIKSYLDKIEIKKVVTISWSSTVFSILKELRPELVIVSESRPNMEGRITAIRLAESDIKVSFFVDSVLPSLVKGADFVIIGADTLYPDGSIVNKIGSFSLALSAKYFNIPFYVASHTLKLKLKEEKDDNIEEYHSIDEVWNITDKNIKVFNPYFEKVPSELITCYFTEKGYLSKDDLLAISNKRREIMAPLNL